jgi:hypothetical protein
MSRTYPGDFWLNCAMAGMELCWLTAWVNYFSLMIYSAPYPWHNALVSFFGSALAMFLGRRDQRLIYQVGLIHLVFMSAAVLWGLHSYYGHGAVVWDFSWIRALTAADLDAKGFLLLAAVIFFSLLFWVSGRYWYMRGQDYNSTSRSFDRGLGALLGLFTFKFLLRVRFEEDYPDPFGSALFVGFFLFALPALARSRSRNRTDLTGRISGGLWNSSLGVLLSFMLLAGGAASFYLPYFNQAAQTGYVVLEKTLSPLGPYIIAILKFIFAPRSTARQEAAPSQADQAMAQVAKTTEIPLWLEIIIYVLGCLLALLVMGILLTLLVLTLRHFFRWLASSTGQRREQPSLWQELCQILKKAWGWIARRLLGFDPGLSGEVLIYYRLKKWGRHSGLMAKTGETPREYGGRLVLEFPELANELDAVIEAHEQAVYARNPNQTPVPASPRRRLGRLASPVWWPRRLKIRLRGSRQN